MFISSYEWLREHIVGNTTIQNLIQLEYNAFEPACVPVCTFTLRNERVDVKGDYIKLSEFRGYENQPNKTLEAIQNPSVNFRFFANQLDFQKIPDSPIAYWVSKNFIDAYEKNPLLGKKMDSRVGLATANNDLFLRYWNEVNLMSIGFGFEYCRNS